MLTLTEAEAVNDIAMNLRRAALQYGKDMVKDKISDALFGKLVNVGPDEFKGGNAGFAAVLTAFAEACKAASGKCYLKGIPTFVNGVQTPFTSEHIFESLMGLSSGTNDGITRPLPFLLVKRSDRSDVKPSIRSSSTPCVNSKLNYECDEYPFASSWAGGQMNYDAGNVSLKSVPGRDNGGQGSRLRWFYDKTRANVRNNTPYLNLALPELPGFWIDRSGVLCGRNGRRC